MAKDPAFLFYPNDWLGGTSTMDMTSRGCYISLLVAQFNHGPLDEKVIKKVLEKHYKKVWPELQKKFTKNEAGFYVNKRLEEEQEKRSSHSRKQKERIEEYWKRKKALLGDDLEYTAVSTKHDTKGFTKTIPLEDRDRNIINKKGVEKSFDLILPFGSEAFLKIWLKWMEYRIEARKPYHTTTNEQSALDKLKELSGDNEKKAIQIVNDAISNNWINFYPSNEAKKEQLSNPTQATEFTFRKKS